jgi:mgtE-like transporter
MILEKKILKEVSVAEVISITGGLLAGLFLAKITGVLEAIPGIIILLPPFLSMRGNISGCLAARLGSGLHLELIKPYKFNRELLQNIYASFGLSVIVSFFIGIIAYVFSLVLGLETMGIRLIFISVFAGILSTFFMLSLTIFAIFWLFSHDYDPDNIMGPYITTIGDIISIASLFIVSMMMV